MPDGPVPMEDKAAQHAPLRDLLASRSEILLAYVFGSLGEQDRQPGPDSDVDLAVAGAGPTESGDRLALMDDLATATGRPVDLVDLHTAGPVILTQALTRGTCLVKRDRALLARLIVRMWYLNEDFLPLVRMIQDARRRRFLHGP